MKIKLELELMTIVIPMAIVYLRVDRGWEYATIFFSTLLVSILFVVVTNYIIKNF